MFKKNSSAFGIYSYRRYVFENVVLPDSEQLLLYIHLDKNYEESPFALVEVYNKNCEFKEYKLTGSDKKELSK